GRPGGLRRAGGRRRGRGAAPRAGRAGGQAPGSTVNWRSRHRLRDTVGVSALAFSLLALLLAGPVPALLARAAWPLRAPRAAIVLWQAIALARSEERRVGKEWRSRGASTDRQEESRVGMQQHERAAL